MRYFDSDVLRQKALRFYERGKVQVAYLKGDDTLFPLRLGFKIPSEKTIRSDFGRIRDEVRALEASGLPLEYKTFRFASLGEQRLPVAVLFATREDYLDTLDLRPAFEAFVHDSSVVLDAFADLRTLLTVKPKLIETHLGNWERIIAVCRYLVEHPRPGIYLRQLPVEGVDTKFVESHKKVLDLLLTQLLPETAYDTTTTSLALGGFERKYGLRTPQPMVRFRLLDPACFIAGLEEMVLGAEAFASLKVGVRSVFVVENLATFLAFPSYPRAMVIFGSGYGARYLKAARWLERTRLYYWGDLDSHGFAILSQFRAAFGHTASLMMERETAERFAHLAVTEPQSKRFEGEPTLLTPQEAELFKLLRQKRFRLEQERIPFGYVEAVLGCLQE